MIASAGAVILHSDSTALKKWVLASLEHLEPASHGDRWSHRFLLQEIRKDLAVCFYIIDGYESADENLAFEHAFFVLDEFLDELEDDAPAGNYLAFVEVGDDIGEDFIGSSSIQKTLKKLGIRLDEIRAIRSNIDQEGTPIWGIGPKMKP